MKLHFSGESVANSRLRKIKAVAHELKINLEEVLHEVNANLSAISPINTLPLLQTEQGTFFSSNTIIRYLSAISECKLYGANLHERALVDQWLDITTCDLEAAVIAVAIAKEGRELDTNKVVEDLNKFLSFVDKHLKDRKFLVGESLSLADLSLASNVSIVLSTAYGEEDRKTHFPHLTAWYLTVAEHNPNVGSKDLPKDAHKSFKPKANKEDKKKEEVEKKEEKKPEKEKVKQLEDDLFDDAAPAAPAAPKKEAPKKEKKKAIAKTIVVFNVKVYEQEQDLAALAAKIRKEVILDGLVWNTEDKILPIAFGMNMLQLGCVVEDDKVMTDDIFDRITAWEDEVQSVDTVSLQKL